MTSLQPGDTTLTYRDLTYKTWEIGLVKLVEVVDDDGDMELWKVQFLDGTDPSIQELWVDPDDVPAHLERIKSGGYDNEQS
jgi:hypothetical protein